MTQDVFCLEKQVSHKVDIFNDLMASYPSTTQFHFMGHSVGAYINLQLLKARGNALKESNQLGKVILLFPTITQIKDTPNGVWISVLFLFF
jgi:alpha/beta superfamily hydrolase